MRRLKDALLEVAKRVEREKTYEGKNEELHSANAAAVELFSTPDPVWRSRVPGEAPVNVSFLALWRANRYCRRRGINWPSIDWEVLVEWLFNNWDKILRVLLSLLVLI